MYPQTTMLLIPAALLVGIVGGLAVNMTAERSPSDVLGTLRTIRVLELWILAVGAVVTMLVGLNLGSGYAAYVLATALVCVAYGAFVNRHLTGMSVITIGATLNLIPLLVNGYLPVDPQALIAIGLVDADAIDRVVVGAGRQLQSGDDLIVVLGPMIGVRWLREVFSFGDLLMATGVCNVAFRLFWPVDETLRPVARREVAVQSAAARSAAQGTTPNVIYERADISAPAHEQTGIHTHEQTGIHTHEQTGIHTHKQTGIPAAAYS